ncbi:hypothetical protein [Thiolapillus sp.]|uniref:hypothetical protein n=1 Tax=Thiolapillus sp. TaxID=2017437 RepID=UPI0025F57AEE|nr:hypothetical protein [Thiolapillus sp.]
MTRTAGAPIGCQRPSRFWGLGCPKIYHEVEDTLGPSIPMGRSSFYCHPGFWFCCSWQSFSY